MGNALFPVILLGLTIVMFVLLPLASVQRLSLVSLSGFVIVKTKLTVSADSRKKGGPQSPDFPPQVIFSYITFAAY